MVIEPQCAVVLGHSSGLGRALTQAFLDRGDHVVGVSRTRWSSAPPELVELEADLLRDEDRLVAAEFVRTHVPRLDILVYSAGLLSAQDLSEIDGPRLEQVLGVNLVAPMVIESQLLDVIVRDSTYVVNVTSNSILESYPDFAEYAASKAAFSKFTADLRLKLQPTGARVMDLCSSGFTSSMYGRMLGKKIDRDESVQMPVEQVAELVLFVLGLPPPMEVPFLYLNRK